MHGHILGFLKQTHVRLLAVLHQFYQTISCSLHHPHYIPDHIVNCITLSNVYPRKIRVKKEKTIYVEFPVIILQYVPIDWRHTHIHCGYSNHVYIYIYKQSNIYIYIYIYAQ